MTAKTPSLLRSLQDALRDRPQGAPAPSPALVALAKAYAAQIDTAPADFRAKMLAELGPKLLATLAALGMSATPAQVVPASGRLTTASAGPIGAEDVLARMREQRRGSA